MAYPDGILKLKKLDDVVQHSFMLSSKEAFILNNLVESRLSSLYYDKDHGVFYNSNAIDDLFSLHLRLQSIFTEPLNIDD